jgi:hypothetical protein
MEDQYHISIEDEFSLKKFEMELDKLSTLEEAKDLCYFLRRQLMMREIYYRHLLRRQWFGE